VRESYTAEKYQNPRNVGVIGIALFNEAGSSPRTDEEVRRPPESKPISRPIRDAAVIWRDMLPDI